MPRPHAAVVAMLALATAVPARAATPIPSDFQSRGPDRTAIQTLLDTYVRAVSTKDQALFETLLLNPSVPFSDTTSAVRAAGAPHGTENYARFRSGVFSGPPFTQRFQDVHVLQDGPLADVTLVFVNSSAQGDSWGWKTLQLLKVAGRWKIASEFYTGHG
jgi:hypothetical protein